MARTDLYFVPPTVTPGESISWSTLHNDPNIVTHEWDRPVGNASGGYVGSGRLVRVEYVGIPFTPIPYCTYGDYDNSTAVERSNVRVMHERFPWLVYVTGDHGSVMLGYLGKRETQNPELLEAIDALESYPLADESDHSELESEMEHEAWINYGRHDFATELEGLLDARFPERTHDLGVSYDQTESHAIDELWWQGCNALNVNGGDGKVIESGGSVHFYTDEWCTKAARDPDATSYNGDWSLAESLAELSTRFGTIVPGADVTLDLNVRRMCVAIWLGMTGEVAPRELIAMCTDVESCSVLADYLDERTPQPAPDPQLDLNL